MIGAPGQKPRFHIFVSDVVARLDLPACLPDFGAHAFLVGNVRFDSVGDQEIRASPRLSRQLREALLDGRLEPDTEGGAGSVRHKHFLAHWSKARG